jgi:hypothetical protein
MEEDDPTPHALPRWVELEYKVSERALSPLECHNYVIIFMQTYNIAHAHACRTHWVHSLYESLERDKCLTLRRLF